ncbi:MULTISPECIES: alpha/beta family hydrolase [Pseudoalteromonas]|uniref:Alpha/beta hydrolase n=1 Tax=Pseudoalteromonas amylolytica TaxID=1859457 RepID=A0A1S1MKY4_9GAMM|nr:MULTISPECIES: alpha/beta family hydrolase [Pseudoalteromonas]OHU85758.1 alpha/beta hydrolase [Pseudoalteromonas sp. JW3]OHU87340.1 alpha/beta hydrolase [Pseudoalteromonas amylolytica]
MTIQWFKPNKPIAQFVFAHGAGAGSDSPFMQTMAQHLCDLGILVGLFDFEYMQQAKALGKRRPPDRAPKLLACFASQLAQIDSQLPLFVGGKSMGGRMASMLVTEGEYPIKGVIAMGYPFHPPGKPDKLRTEHFADIPCPFLVLQGERDTFGNQAELAQLQLDKAPEYIFFADGDHSLKPRKKSGYSEAEHLLEAAQQAAKFMREHAND